MCVYAVRVCGFQCPSAIIQSTGIGSGGCQITREIDFHVGSRLEFACMVCVCIGHMAI